MSPSFVTERPASARQPSFWGVLGALFALGCGTSSIEAVVSDDVTAQAGGAATVPPEQDCDEPTSGTFILRGETGCLGLGEPTSVFGTPALTVQPSTDCASREARWELTPAVEGTFTLRNVESTLFLDVRAGSDLPGTPVILYAPNQLDNQRFWLRLRRAGAYELSPRHAPSLCVEARAAGLEMRSCEPESSAQTFALSRNDCS